MSQFIIYEPDVGKIRYKIVGLFPPESLARYEELGLTWMEWVGDIETATHVFNGEPVTIIPPVVPPTAAELITAITLAVQQHLDSTARARNYDNILSLASYSVSTDPVFASEGTAGAAWRDACWRYCYGALAEVQAGTRAMPTPEEAVSELPAMVWPAPI